MIRSSASGSTRETCILSNSRQTGATSPNVVHEHLKRGESVIVHIEGREDKRRTALSVLYRLNFSYRELKSFRPEQPYPLMIDGLRPFADDRGGRDWAEALKKWDDLPVTVIFTIESLHQLPIYAFRATLKHVSNRLFFRPVFSCTDHTVELLDGAYTPEQLLDLELGSYALIGCGISRFLGGIHGTPDVPNEDVSLGIPWSPYFMGYVEGGIYVGAKSFGTIFFPGVEFFMGVPIPVIWPALLGVLFLWTSPHPARTEANEKVMGK